MGFSRSHGIHEYLRKKFESIIATYFGDVSKCFSYLLVIEEIPKFHIIKKNNNNEFFFTWLHQLLHRVISQAYFNIINCCFSYPNIFSTTRTERTLYRGRWTPIIKEQVATRSFRYSWSITTAPSDNHLSSGTCLFLRLIKPQPTRTGWPNVYAHSDQLGYAAGA